MTRISLDEARDRIAEAFKRIDLSHNQRILVNAPVATGKTRAAAELCQRAADQGISSLVLVPLHALGKEWIEALSKAGLPATQIVQLYGPTYPKVNCRHIHQAKQYLPQGQSRLFNKLCCNQAKCDHYDNCLHIRSRTRADQSKVLIATHSHLAYPDFCYSAYNNQERQLVIIDELIELSRQTAFNYPQLRQLARVLEWEGKKGEKVELEETVQQLRKLVGEMLHSLRQRKDQQLPGLDISPQVAGHLNNQATQYYLQHWEHRIQANILASLIQLTILPEPPMLKYSRFQDSLIASWVPLFQPKSTVLMLSATTQLDYLNRYYQPNKFKFLCDEDKWQVDYSWVKVIQMLAVSGGRARLLFDKKLQRNVISSINAILYQHRHQRIALVCAKGTKVQAKEQFIELLNDAFAHHSRQLVSVEASDLAQSDKEALPNGREQVPVIHYGVIGINSLDQYDVVVELTGFYVSSHDIIQQLDSINPQTDQLLEYQVFQEPQDFHLPAGKTESVVRTKYAITGHPNYSDWLQLVRKVKEDGEISQTEGRFIRQQRDHPITIYRFHNINIKPYPVRYYKKWLTFRLQEFSQQMSGWLQDPEEQSSKINKWRRLIAHLQQTVGKKEFTYRHMSPIISSNHSREVRDLVDTGLIQDIVSGGKGQGRKRKMRLSDLALKLNIPCSPQ